MRIATSIAVLICVAITACGGAGGTTDSGNGTVLRNIDPSLRLEDQIARLPGVYRNEHGELRIRGSTRPPLVVIDGMQTMTSDLSAIDPVDVDQVEVLKGPETSIYGVRGGGGVIVITTKMGGS